MEYKLFCPPQDSGVKIATFIRDFPAPRQHYDFQHDRVTKLKVGNRLLRHKIETITKFRFRRAVLKSASIMQ